MADNDESTQRAPVQYTEQKHYQKPAADDPFDIFNSISTPATAPVTVPQVQDNVFGFSNHSTPATQSYHAPSQPAAADDPFAMFSPSKPVAAPAAAPVADDHKFLSIIDKIVYHIT